MRSDQFVELRLTPKRLKTASSWYEKNGLWFVKLVSFVVQERITTDRLQVTEEAVRSLNPPSR